MQIGELVHRAVTELDAVVRIEVASGPASLLEVVLIDIDRQHVSTASRELKRVEPGVAANVQGSRSLEIVRDVRGDLSPFERRKVPEGMIGRGAVAAWQPQVVKPWGQLSDPLTDRIAGDAGFVDVRSLRDLAGIERVTVMRRAG